MAILVTGGEGYIGSHCVITLIDKGYNVIIFDNESTGFAFIGEILKRIRSNGKIIDIVKGASLIKSILKNYFLNMKSIQLFISLHYRKWPNQ